MLMNAAQPKTIVTIMQAAPTQLALSRVHVMMVIRVMASNAKMSMSVPQKLTFVPLTLECSL